jgi:uncharacterized protein YodC (DUF2158 family)
MSTIWKEGDVVMLKSGGPKMTVDSFDPKFGVSCSWFEEGTRRTACFESAYLIPATSVPTSATLRPAQ